MKSLEVWLPPGPDFQLDTILDLFTSLLHTPSVSHQCYTVTPQQNPQFGNLDFLSHLDREYAELRILVVIFIAYIFDIQT